MTDNDQNASPSAIRLTRGGLGVQKAAGTRQQNAKTMRIRVNMFPPYCEIALTKGQVAKVSPEDYERLSKYNWHARWSKCTSSFYAYRGITVNKKWTCQAMHREVLGFLPFDIRHVDHINHDTLDNTRSNLRQATRSENNRNRRIQRNNTNGLPGTYLDKNRNKWIAKIGINGTRFFLGYFSSQKEAYAAYLNAAEILPKRL